MRISAFNSLLRCLAVSSLLGLMAVSGPVAMAQDNSQPQTPVVTEVDPEYVLGPEDVLAISVRGVPDFSGEFAVGKDGHMSYPILGDLFVAGMKPRELQAKITKGLAKELRDPQVTVNLRQMRISRIYVLGSVAHPAYYDYRKGWRLSELVAAAGGLSAPPERLKAVIFRTGSPTQKIDLRQIFIDANDQADIPLQLGDVVNIQPDATMRINVVGEVKNSGVREIFDGQGAVEAIAAASGTTERAALSRAKISRHGQDIPADLYAAVINGDPSKNVPLEDGDTLYIPQQFARVAVVGNVQHPGPQVLPDGRPWTLTQAVADAGGPAPRAKTAGVQLTRKGPDGKLHTTGYNLKLIGTKAHPDPVLEENDVVFIPQSGKADIGEITSFGNLYYLVRVLFGK